MNGHKLTPKQVNVADLVPYTSNSRTHSDEQVAQIAASIREFGFNNPILTDGENGIIAGHGRLLAARKLGMKEVPTIELSHLTKNQRKAYIIADNKLALNAGWDMEMLSLEMGDLKDEGFDLSLIGFDDDELANIFVDKTEGLTDPDDVPDVPDDPVTKEGDVWLLGKHRLMCGDSTSIDAVDKLMAGKKADFCFTSPPYNGNTSVRTGTSSSTKLYSDNTTDDKSSDDYIKFNKDILTALYAVTKDNFICCYNINYNKKSPSEYIDVAYAAKNIIPLRETIAWEKHMAVSLQGDNLTRIYEFIFVLAKGAFKINKTRSECVKNLWKINNAGAQTENHGACFPVALPEQGIRYFAPHGANIIEPFSGTGTTIIAAEKTGCKAFAMELSPAYVDVAVKRWQDFTGEQATLEGSGENFPSIKADAA